MGWGSERPCTQARPGEGFAAFILEKTSFTFPTTRRIPPRFDLLDPGRVLLLNTIFFSSYFYEILDSN